MIHFIALSFIYQQIYKRVYTHKKSPDGIPSGDNIKGNVEVRCFYSASSEVSLQSEAFQPPLRFDHCSAVSSLTSRLVAIIFSV